MGFNNSYQMKLSIIVPVYNVEAYVEKCLGSLLKQDINAEDYEIIVIDDGSTDKSIDIVEQIQRGVSNIKVIRQSNQGLGAARNAGIAHSSGEYLMFVDSDDYIEYNVLNQVLSIVIEKDLEVLRFNYLNVSEDGTIIPKTFNALKNVQYIEEVTSGNEFIAKQMGWACYVWLYLFSAKFIKEQNVKFRPSVYFEDVFWLLEVLQKSEKVSAIDLNVYYYLQRAGSITKSVSKEKKHKIFSDKLLVLQWIRELSEETTDYQLRKWYSGFISLTMMGLFAFVENELPDRKGELLSFTKRSGLRPYRGYNFTLKQKRDLILMNVSPELYMFLRRHK